MFNKKCPKCNKKVNKAHKFCHSCGNNLNSESEYEKEDYGILGKNDFIEENSKTFSPHSLFFDKLFSNAIKMLEKQLKDFPERKREEQDFSKKIPNNLRVQFFVNGKKMPEKQIYQQERKIEPVIKQGKIDSEKIKQISKLPRKEAKSKIRRLAGKMIYELKVPGVEDINNIIINKLENSIEVKAIAKNKVYFKTINLNLPILRYGLLKDDLILELQAK